MADNVAITPGSGAVIASDDVAGVQYQRVKLVDGTADSAAAISGDATNGLDVDVTRLSSLLEASLPAPGSDGVLGTLVADLFGRLRVAMSDTDQNLFSVAYYQTGAHLVLASADAATAGRWFLVNTSATRKVRVVGVYFTSQMGSNSNFFTSPRLQLERFIFTGSPSGATITPALRAAGESPVASLRTASTGMTITSGAVVHAWLPSLGGNVPVSTSVDPWLPPPERRIVLAQNEGLLLRQPDAGSASDARRFLTTVIVEEY